MENTPLKFLRLVTGEDLIALLHQIDDKTFKIINPLKLVYTLGEKPGVIVMGFVHWIFPEVQKTQEYVLKSSDILTIAEPSEHIEVYYHESLKMLDKSLKYSIGKETSSENDDYEYIQDVMKSLQKIDRRKLH